MDSINRDSPRTFPIPCCLAMIVASLAASCVSTGGVAPLDPALSPQAAIEAYVADGTLPGVAVSVVRDGAVAFRGVDGVRKRGDPAPVTVDDAFHIGSNTKAMTALLCAIAVDRGLLSWSSTISGVMGAGYPMRDEYRFVTLEQLLSHTSGMPANLPDIPWMSYFGTDAPVADERDRMARAALALKPTSPAGTAFEYSNIGYVVAARMLEETSGKPWEELMATELFGPLDMTGAGFGPPALAGYGAGATPTAPWGHNPSPVDPASTYADNPPPAGPAGTVHAALSDLEAWAGLYLNGGLALDGSRLVSAEALAETTKPRLRDYGFGWIIGTDEWERPFIAHDGSNTTFYCIVLIYQDLHGAVIAMTNRGDGPTGQALASLVNWLVMKYLPPDTQAGSIPDGAAPGGTP